MMFFMKLLFDQIFFKTKRISSYRFESGIACLEGTDHLILKEICLNADILIAAIGQPNFVTADMVKPGAVIIDVGTTRVDDATRERGWRLVGDVKFDEVAPKCSFISPVPGGVGPMTIASLMMNTLKAMELKGK